MQPYGLKGFDFRILGGLGWMHFPKLVLNCSVQGSHHGDSPLETHLRRVRFLGRR